MKKYCIIGEDERSNYLRKMYLNSKIRIVDFKEADYIIAQIPFTRDGIYLTDTNIKCDEFISNIKGKILFTGVLKDEIKVKLDKVKYYDLMEIDEVAILNAIPTAEGALLKAIENSDITIHGANCLVMGYGRIGKVLTNMLKALGANVYCEARKARDLAYIDMYGYKKVPIERLDEYIPNMDYIFNTIPVKLLDKDKLKLVNKDTLIIDLASNPGGVDLVVAKQIGINVIWALSLPTKVAPRSAAKYLKDAIDRIIEESQL